MTIYAKYVWMQLSIVFFLIVVIYVHVYNVVKNYLNVLFADLILSALYVFSKANKFIIIYIYIYRKLIHTYIKICAMYYIKVVKKNIVF
jgi:hypothetical protein